jgi:uncharacterized protein (DUF885 family)
MKNYKNFFDDLIKINPSLSYEIGNRDIKSCSHITNDISDNYLSMIYKLSLKYASTNDIELKFELDYIKYYFQYKIYLYFIICPFDNIIINFYYENKLKEHKKYAKTRIADFNKYIKTIIERLKEGLKLKIIIPYIICIKFMKQIKDYNKELYNFIKNDYLNKCRKTIGLCHLPNGKKIYKILVKNTLGGLSQTPEEIHNLGLSLVKKIKIKNKDFYYTSQKKLFKDCQKLALYIYDNIIENYFHYKPDKPFTLKIVSKELEKTTALAYYMPSDDIVYINLSYYREVDKQSLYSLLMHECMHQYHYRLLKYYKLPYYQIYGYENNTLIEGFAHYMEIYCENYDDSDDLSILRKLRLVVDTGINYYGWTHKKAFNYMNKYLPNRTNDILNEIERYICMPGQSVCYLIGKLEIIKMRDKFLKEKRGTIKDFHHKLLIKGPASFLTLHKINKNNN